MELDTPLGKWFPVKRHSWFDVYKSPTALFWRPDTIIHTMRPTGVSGFYMIDGTVPELPLDCHPISFQVMNETIWTRRRYSMTIPQRPDSPPPGITIMNGIHSQDSPLHIGCDASLHPAPNIATCAWVIENPEQSQIQAHANILNISSFTTYRSELEGIYRLLQHIQTLNLHPPSIRQWCNNKAAIDNATRGPTNPSQMTRLDADILLAISALRHKYSPCVITHRHVYGHQDTRHARQRTSPLNPSDSSSLDSEIPATSLHTRSHDTESRRLNILSDTIAGTAATDILRGLLT